MNNIKKKYLVANSHQWALPELSFHRWQHHRICTESLERQPALHDYRAGTGMRRRGAADVQRRDQSELCLPAQHHTAG